MADRPTVEQDGFNIPLSEILGYFANKGQGLWSSGVDYLEGVNERPLSALADIQRFGSRLMPGAAMSQDFGDMMTSGALGAANRMGATFEYPESGGSIPSNIRIGTKINRPQPQPPTAPEKPSPEAERGNQEMFRYRSPDDLGPMDPRGYSPDEPYISPEHEMGITDRGGLDEASQRHTQGAMDREQSQIETGEFPSPQQNAPQQSLIPMGSTPQDQGPSTWDRIQQALTDPRTGRLLADFRRSGQRPDSSRPYAQMGFDQQTQEIKGERQAQDKLAQDEALKREELSTRERMSQAELDSRERIAQMDREAQEARYDRQYGEPISEELAAALGPDAAAWVGRPVDEYRQWKAEQRMQASSEATSAYQMMVGIAQMDKRNKAMESLKMIMDNPFAMRFLAEADPQRYAEAQAVMAANGWPTLPPQETLAPPPGTEAVGADDPRKGVFGQLWDWVLEGLGIQPSGMAEGAPGVPGPQNLSAQASLPETAMNGGAPRPNQGPFQGLSRADQETIAGIFRKHAGDKETIRRELSEFAESSDANGMKDQRRMTAIGQFLAGM